MVARRGTAVWEVLSLLFVVCYCTVQSESNFLGDFLLLEAQGMLNKRRGKIIREKTRKAY